MIKITLERLKPMSDKQYYIAKVETNDAGETVIRMRPTKNGGCCSIRSCCICELTKAIAPYIVIGVLGGCALLKFDGGCSTSSQDKIVTSYTNTVMRIEASATIKAPQK